MSTVGKSQSCMVSELPMLQKGLYWEEMVSVWDLVNVPKGVLNIPKIYNNDFEFDLSKMTEVQLWVPATPMTTTAAIPLPRSF